MSPSTTTPLLYPPTPSPQETFINTALSYSRTSFQSTLCTLCNTNHRPNPHTSNQSRTYPQYKSLKCNHTFHESCLLTAETSPCSACKAILLYCAVYRNPDADYKRLVARLMQVRGGDVRRLLIAMHCKAGGGRGEEVLQANALVGHEEVRREVAVLQVTASEVRVENEKIGINRKTTVKRVSRVFGAWFRG